MYEIKKEDYAGGTITLYADESPESPREWDNLGTILHWHKRGFCGEVDASGWEREDIAAHIKEIEAAGGVVLPVFLYEHSGQTVNTTGFNCPWDSGQVGYIYAEAEKIAREFAGAAGGERKNVATILAAEIKTLDQYLRGEAVGYVAEVNGEQVGSCWGFYPDESAADEYGYIMAEARGEIDWEQKQAQAYACSC